MSTATTPEAPATTEPTKTAPKRSAVEGIKESSRQLRGTIGEELHSGCDHFNEQNKQLIKFHGSYQQEDRDARKSRRKEGVGKYYMFMVRCKIPGGRLTADQYLAVDKIAGDHANGTLRFTSRQGIQLHGILMTGLKDTIAGINSCLLSTLGACGDVNRNVMACPAPCRHNTVRAELQDTAAILAAQFAPRTHGYHEIWLNGQSVGPQVAEQDIEPIYGKVYLPRKFKIGLGLPDDNCVDLYAQDLGLLAVVEHDKIIGYNVMVGGGMGMTHGNANTFPHLARPICFVPTRGVVNGAEAVIKLFRDHGNRADRKRARIKYVVHDWGVKKFREVLSEYVGGKLDDPMPVEVTGFETHLGWHPQGDGKWYYGLHIDTGRVKDEGPLRARSGLRALIERFRPSLRITAVQDILLCDLDSHALPEIEKTLAEFGIRRSNEVTPVRSLSMACPAIPTCGLAISESERMLPDIVSQLETELKRLGLEQEKISVRSTGCPNGCARPYQSDIGIVGRSGDKYVVYVGGSVLGNRLNFQLRDLVPSGKIVPTIVPVLEKFKTARQAGESFGDFCCRLGLGELEKLLPATAEKKEARQEEEKPLAAAETAPAANHVGLNGHAHAAPPQVAAQPARPPAMPERETYYAGKCGEELPDYALVYNSEGSVRETVVYFYGEDRRAAQAHPGEPMRREAVYSGRVDPYRLFAARKASDTYYVGPAGQVLRDRRTEYHPDGTAARQVIFYYDGDVRANQAPTGAALRRQATFTGLV